MIYAGSHDLNYESRLEDVQACVDPMLCRLMMNNLVGNAVKYSADGTRVDITLEGDATVLSITVKDQGIGIPPEDLDRLFEDFHRGSNTADFKGSGVGLAVVRRVLDCHGGHVTVDSTPNEGSIFSVHLPRTRENCG
jgi:signal transduction histidine kinase